MNKSLIDSSSSVVPGFAASAALLGFLVLFFGVNLHNVFVGQRMRRGKARHAEVPSPGNLWTMLASIGTIIFMVEAVAYGFLGLLGGDDTIPLIMVPLGEVQAALGSLGLALIAVGVLVFVWSVVTRGRYSVSWEMPEDHRLVTWGPYKYVSHPSYSGYFLMFLGLALLVNNPAVMVPLIAVPGYVNLVDTEEVLLVSRFGDEYRRYAETTGRFIPRLRRSR